MVATIRQTPRTVGRYELHEQVAAGGMATVHIGRLLGEVGFSRAVALKRLHEKYARDPGFVSKFLDEARLATRIRHPNVVATLDVVASQGELFLVMEYVHGESVARLLKALLERRERVPLPVVAAIMTDVLEGLHAAHEAKSERGEPLRIVHRDVSPQNVLVDTDGVSRVLDFGIAMTVRVPTDENPLKGKMPYVSPEQLQNRPIDRRADIWAASVVCWEMLVGRRLFTADSSLGLASMILETAVPPPSTFGGSPALDAVILRGLTKDRDGRYASAREMATAIEAATPIASNRAVAEWLDGVAGASLRERAAQIADMESRGSRERPSGATRIELAGLASAADPDPGVAFTPLETMSMNVGNVGNLATDPTLTAPGPPGAPPSPPVARAPVTTVRTRKAKRSPVLGIALALVVAVVLVGGAELAKNRLRSAPAPVGEAPASPPEEALTAVPVATTAPAIAVPIVTAAPAIAPPPASTHVDLELPASASAAAPKRPRPRPGASVAPPASARGSEFGRDPW